MGTSSELRRGRHFVFMMHDHLVFITKYFSRVCADFEAELVEFDGEEDHVHLLVNYPPKVAVSRLVNSLKGASSRLIRTKN